jgi:hypothetical protein
VAIAQPVVHRPEANPYIRTRRGLHGVAEMLIAGPQHRRPGTIRLAVTPRGFRGAMLPIAVEGTELVWPQGRAKLAGPLAGLGAAAGVDIGAPVGVYHSSASLPVDAVLDLDAHAAVRVHHSLRIGAQALKAFTAGRPPVLWPERFDVSVAVDAANYGVSTGDSSTSSHMPTSDRPQRKPVRSGTHPSERWDHWNPATRLPPSS